VLLLRKRIQSSAKPQRQSLMNDGRATIDIDDFDSFWQLQAAKHPTSVVVELLIAKGRLYKARDLLERREFGMFSTLKSNWAKLTRGIGWGLFENLSGPQRISTFWSHFPTRHSPNDNPPNNYNDEIHGTRSFGHGGHARWHWSFISRPWR
jgi:hypothetical protein